jgi:hypothetical protein
LAHAFAPALLYLPAVQFEHAFWPDCALYWPLAQFGQYTCPSCACAVPGLQSVHADWSCCPENLPLGHAVHVLLAASM